ncbi:hypothetical protein Tco_1082212 [Tanacetum coccineum]|uniref:Uncharacterized protein n=1 Tax=Tanacetum coccineum TaxID=301880 RepID=A0ABQ5I1X3_9ASTR
MSKVLHGKGDLEVTDSIEAYPERLQSAKSILTIIEADASSIRRIGSHQYAVSTGQNNKKESYGPQFLEAYSYEASYIDKSIPRKENDPGSFTLPCYINNVCFNNALADLGASVSDAVVVRLLHEVLQLPRQST